MKAMIACLMLIFVAGASKIAHQHHTKELCEGFAPENDMKIPVGTYFAEGGGITEAEFNAVIDRAYDVYGPIIAAKGKKLDIERLWSNGTVNANAQQIGNTWKVRMYGGLARHPRVNVEGFTEVVCHELGHHLGGAPKTGGWNAWASNEGQSDYFATTKCMRKMYTQQENDDYNKSVELDEFAYNKCTGLFAGDTNKLAHCYRSAAGGLSLSWLLRDLREGSRAKQQKTFALPINVRLKAPGPSIPLPQFDTPDPNVVSRTNSRHPASQCRLDTYFQGALCTVSADVDPDNKDAKVGACNRPDFTEGVRPLCWYKPSN